jgi:hypothetical protein
MVEGVFCYLGKVCWALADNECLLKGSAQVKTNYLNCIHAEPSQRRLF